MKPILHANGRRYIPVIERDGKMRAYATAAYGTGEHKGTLMLSVYLVVRAEGADQARAYRKYRVQALRERIEHMPMQYQQNRLQFMLDVVATQQECELELREPMSLRG